mmetsp:Transcript_726/g.986  ORF Transcript_726/g.986 Transcript_726/m.986 type:complete len:422 (+) Transcript_726:84-1349(+)
MNQKLPGNRKRKQNDVSLDSASSGPTSSSHAKSLTSTKTPPHQAAGKEKTGTSLTRKKGKWGIRKRWRKKQNQSQENGSRLKDGNKLHPETGCKSGEHMTNMGKDIETKKAESVTETGEINNHSTSDAKRRENGTVRNMEFEGKVDEESKPSAVNSKKTRSVTVIQHTEAGGRGKLNLKFSTRVKGEIHKNNERIPSLKFVVKIPPKKQNYQMNQRTKRKSNSYNRAEHSTSTNSDIQKLSEGTRPLKHTTIKKSLHQKSSKIVQIEEVNNSSQNLSCGKVKRDDIFPRALPRRQAEGFEDSMYRRTDLEDFEKNLRVHYERITTNQVENLNYLILEQPPVRKSAKCAARNFHRTRIFRSAEETSGKLIDQGETEIIWSTKRFNWLIRNKIRMLEEAKKLKKEAAERENNDEDAVIFDIVG